MELLAHMLLDCCILRLLVDQPVGIGISTAIGKNPALGLSMFALRACSQLGSAILFFVTGGCFRHGVACRLQRNHSFPHMHVQALVREMILHPPHFK